MLIGKLAGIFTVLAVFTCCLGLFGLAAYLAEQRTKEIGIRKVLGASTSEVFLLAYQGFYHVGGHQLYCLHRRSHFIFCRTGYNNIIIASISVRVYLSLQQFWPL